MTLRSCWASTCQTCPMTAQCTTGKERRIKRWEHEHAVDAMQRRLDQRPDAMRVRRRTAELDLLRKSGALTGFLDREGKMRRARSSHSRVAQMTGVQ
jgi:hypothetical protein